MDAFANGMLLFQLDECKRMAHFENSNLVRQRKAINRNLTVFPGATSGVNSSADRATADVPVIRHPDIRSAASDSSTDPIVSKSSSVRAHTPHSRSHLAVHYQMWRIPRIVKRRTRPIQVEELFKYAFLLASHYVEPGSDPHPPVVSQRLFALDTINDDISSKPSRKKQKVGSSSARGTTNTFLEPSFDYVFPRQTFFRNEDRIVSIGNRSRLGLSLAEL